VGLLNSFVIEWRVRQIARSNHIKKFVLTQLPIPRPSTTEVNRIAGLVAALITADDRFNDLVPLLNGTKSVTGQDERQDLKCQIDAQVAHLLELTEEELDRVLDSFDKVPSATKDLVRSHFRSLVTNKA